MSDILIGVIVFGLVFRAATFGMFPGRNLRVLEQKVNASDADEIHDWLRRPANLAELHGAGPTRR